MTESEQELINLKKESSVPETPKKTNRRNCDECGCELMGAFYWCRMHDKVFCQECSLMTGEFSWSYSKKLPASCHKHRYNIIGAGYGKSQECIATREFMTLNGNI